MRGEFIIVIAIVIVIVIVNIIVTVTIIIIINMIIITITYHRDSRLAVLNGGASKRGVGIFVQDTRECLGHHHRKGTPGIGHIHFVLSASCWVIVLLSVYKVLNVGY